MIQSAALLGLLWVLPVPPGASAKAPERPGAGGLSSRLAILAKPSLKSASESRQAAAVNLPRSGPASLLRSGGAPLVELTVDGSLTATAARLKALGAEIIGLSGRYDSITAAIDPGKLEDAAALPGVRRVGELLAPLVRGDLDGSGTSPSRRALSTCQGSKTSEGDSQLRAADARGEFNINGAGVTVGVLSDSFDLDSTASRHASQDVASGDLPGTANPCGHKTPVQIIDDTATDDATDEGRGMAQIVHDLSPGAKLSFATAFTGSTEMASNIRALGAAGAKVIVDDVVYLDEPFFQDGPISAAVNDVVGNGSAYFSAAGNDNIIDAGGRNIASWETPSFRDGGTCPDALPILANQCLDFNPDNLAVDKTFGIDVEPDETATIDLQWAQPWNGVTTDLDAYLLGTGGSQLANAKSEEANVLLTQKPFEALSWTNNTASTQTIQLVINRNTINGLGNHAEPRVKFVIFETGYGVTETEYPESSGGDVVGPTIFGHSGADSASSVGAIRFSEDSKPEGFSSRGPVTHYFGPVTGPAPAPALSSPDSYSKPDITATDCGVTTFFGGSGNRFCGTSAAAPHAAAVAALQFQSGPSVAPTQIRSDQAGTATPIGAFGPLDVGAGLLNAVGAVGATITIPVITASGPGATADPTPLFTFSSNRPVASFSCVVDELDPVSCTSPFTTASSLSDGEHTFTVSGTDAGGRVGTSNPVSVRVDTKAPTLRLKSHPPKRTRARSARFRFSSEAGATFRCRIDRKVISKCTSPRRSTVRPGKHRFMARAVDSVGNRGKRRVFRWRVLR